MSSPPVSAWMKPYPLALLNHLTVPCSAMAQLLSESQNRASTSDSSLQVKPSLAARERPICVSLEFDRDTLTRAEKNQALAHPPGRGFRIFNRYCRMKTRMVPKTGLEPVRVAPHAPQTCASTNSATWAQRTTSTN